MRSMLATLTLSFTALAAASPVVNLDAPGALEALRAANPAHYDKVVAALDAAQLQPCETLGHLLKTKLDAEDVHCQSALLMTSLPVKRHITFRLDDVTYMSNVVQTKLGSNVQQPVPARSK